MEGMEGTAVSKPRDVMVIHFPYAVQDVERLAEIRDHVLMGINCGVLVLGRDMTYEMIQIPHDMLTLICPVDDVHRWMALGSPEPEPDPETEGPKLLREREFTRLTEQSEAETKRQILQRLKAWRDEHGAGCLDAVSRATRTRNRIDAMTLRDVLNGAAVLPIEDWRKIGLALDRLENQEGTGE